MIGRLQAGAFAAAAVVAFSATAAEPLKPGEWKQSDNKTGGLTVIAEAFLTDTMPGGQLNGVFLAIRCRAGQTSVEIMNWGARSKRDKHVLSVAVDDMPPWQETWSVDKESRLLLGLRDNKSAIDFLNRVFPSEVLTLQFRNNYRMAVHSFRMSKSEPHLRAVADRCGWTLQ